MQTQLQAMWKKLEQEKKKLQEQKTQAIVLIYKNILAEKPISVIHNELAKSTINSNELKQYFKQVSLSASNRIKKIKHNIDPFKERYNEQNDKLVLSMCLVDIIMRGKWNSESQKIINAQMREDENKSKENILTQELTIDVKLVERTEKKEYRDNNKIFWVCSSHNDSAKDHKDWQGKIYYNANYNKNDKRITSYIERYNLKSVQEITGKPVYLITRPHCRHYFTQYTYEEIASGHWKVPTRNVGARVLKTKKIGQKAKDEVRVKQAIQYYLGRLQTIEALRKVQDNDLLKAQSQKCKDLIKKWKKEI